MVFRAQDSDDMVIGHAENLFHNGIVILQYINIRYPYYHIPMIQSVHLQET